MQVPTLAECEAAIGEPASAWVARCYEIASAIVDAGLVSIERGLGGEAVYGHWVGPVSPRSRFADRRHLGFVQHGWIYVQAHDMVIDPTRWAFEVKKPYLFVGRECDKTEELWPYDEGGDRWRTAMQLSKPPPKLDPDAKIVELQLDDANAKFVSTLLGQDDGRRVSAEQVFWLANLPYHVLAKGDLKGLYEAICDAESYFIEFIPIDNRNRARRETGFARR